ncbi:Phytochrome, two-component sensor histidine kinase; Cyanobacterial phytochrome B [hydrothermal vent metagenome]|uniref:Phytochrome, two-component sensor histidine kinase Cyanobacterial phytochrome B n=1 Tax=hydrothermal vent metagenome TaxID=652676 RepID=A0A3B0XKK9_9ZZZZ
MKNKSQPSTAKAENLSAIKEFAIFSIIIWSILIIISIVLNLYQLRSQALDLATQEARANWNKDQVFRRWATRHGGLYVRPDERTPPNPFLSHLSDRDVVTTSGIKLTLMNPAYMMSQMTKEYDEMYGIKGRITGQVLLNPSNMPDPWELAALQRFDKGVKEVSELANIDGEPYMRLIRPMVMTPGCVPCHGHLGFKVGDIRGGVSVSIPIKPYLLAAESSRDVLVASNIGIWLLGLLAIALFTRRNIQRSVERQQVSDALSRSDNEWNYAMDFFEDVIYLTDMDDRVIRANQAFYEMTGQSPEQIINHPIGPVIHPGSEGEPCPVCDARSERRDEIITMEADDSCNPMGKPVEITVRTIRNKDDQPQGTLVGMHDLTRSREAAAELKEREQQISDLLNSTAEGIFGLDMEGNCTLANPACIKLLGYTGTDEFIGNNMHALIHYSYEGGEAYDVSQCPIYQSFKTGSKVHCDSEVFWKADGSSFEVEYWAYPIIRNNQVTGTVVTFIDISERLKTEKILRRSQKMDALGQLTGGIAHDFNNQLGVVSGYLEMLAENKTDNESAERWIAISEKATRRCIDLTRQLLNFSSLQQANTEVVDLIIEMNELKELIQLTVTPAVQVQYDIADEIWPIKTSRGELEDAVINLVINARDAMPEGGEILIEISNQVLDKCNFENQEGLEGDYVVVSVNDTGTGISKEIQEHIFDPFFTTKEIGKGTGLGMSMVYGYIKRNNGCINIYSQPGEGTRVSMCFPRSITITDTMEHDHNGATTRNKYRGENETILVVDDEPQLRDLAVEILQAQGYQTLVAENGNMAIEILQGDAKVDLLFCDVIMPGLNGYQVAEKVRQLRPELIIQLTSGLADVSAMTEQKPLTELNVLQKPYLRSSLIDCIAASLGH